MSDTTEHSWFTEQIAAYIAGGLPPEDVARFEAHANQCESCASELSSIKELEQKMSRLFAATIPAGDFENRLIARLRETAPRLQIHPFVRRAAVAAASIVLLGGFGYVANQRINNGTMPMFALAPSPRVKSASNLRQIGQATLLARNESAAPATQPASGASFGPYDANDAVMLPTDSDDNGRAGKNTAFYGDGHVEFQSNPFTESQRDMIYARRTPATPSQMAAATKQQLGTWQTGAAGAGFGGGADGSYDWKDTSDKTGALSDQLAQNREPKGVREVERKLGEAVATNSPAPVAAPAQTEASRLPALQTSGNLTISGTSSVTRGTTVNGTNTLAAGTVAGKPDVQGGVEFYAGTRITDTGSATSLNYFAPQQFAAGPVDRNIADLGGLKAGHGGTEADARLDREEIARQQSKPADEPAAQPDPKFIGLGQGPKAPEPAPQQIVSQRKVIRNGDMEFEVESFDDSLIKITTITREEGGFVATTNSEKLPNGKVKGVVVVRVAPDHLDTLVLKLRALGDLKRQNLVANDITKQYTDLDSQLRAAKAMQDRLLDMIKSGQGAIKDLLAAEKELGVWREKIEKIEGEMRYYDSQVALSTLSISAYEKEIKAAAAAKQSEQADIGVEAEDVEKARADALKSLDDAKARIIESELKKFDAGQLACKIVADVSPDNSGPVIDRLKQLGKVARLEINRKQTSVDGSSPPVPGAKVERGDTRLVISLYNIANIAPRTTTNITIAAQNVEEAYQKIVARVNKAGGRVVTSNINRDKPNTQAVIQFEVKSADADPTLVDVKSTGEVIRLSMSENPDSNNVTTAKQGFSLTVMSLDQVPPRELNQRELATEDVEKSYRALLNTLAKTNARILTNKMETPGGSNPANAYLDFEIRRDSTAEIDKTFAEAGDSYNQNIQISPDTDNASSSKTRYIVQMHNVAILAPKQSTTLAVEVGNVDNAIGDVTSAVNAVNGKIVDTTRSKEQSGQTIARLMLDVPFKTSAEIIDKVRSLGVVRVEQIASNPQAPGGALARARLAVTIASPDVIVSSDRGLWATIRNGLSTSVTGLMWSLQLIVIGLCLVGPWVLLMIAGWKTWKWSKRNTTQKVPAPG